jgi:hypothetical protein
LNGYDYDFTAAVGLLERWLKEYEAKVKIAGSGK